MNRSLVTAAMVMPAAMVAAVSMVLIGGSLVHAGPFWRREPLNPSEAAARRDRATLMHLIDQGSDPLARYAVPAGILGPQLLELTPLEAAIAADRAEVVELLLWRLHGLDADTVTRAWCLSLDQGDGSVSRVIANERPDVRSADCARVVRPW